MGERGEGVGERGREVGVRGEGSGECLPPLSTPSLLLMTAPQEFPVSSKQNDIQLFNHYMCIDAT